VAERLTGRMLLPRKRACKFCGEMLLVEEDYLVTKLTPSAEKHLQEKHGWPNAAVEATSKA
jgi:hypothetical protein